MKRYNQGFLKFGPMEECDTGEWIKAVDADNTMNEIKRQGAKVFSDLSKKIYEENIEAFMDERDPLVKCVRFS